MRVKILWVSKHNPIPSQVRALKELFGEDVTVLRDLSSFADARDVLKKFKLSGADEIVLVAPLTVVQKCCELGLQPLFAEMERVPFGHASAEVHTNGQGDQVRGRGRSYRFVKFRRVLGITVHFQELESSAS